MTAEKKPTPQDRAVLDCAREVINMSDEEYDRRRDALKPLWLAAPVKIQERALSVVSNWRDGRHSTAYCDREVARLIGCTPDAASYIRLVYTSARSMGAEIRP